MCRGLPQKNSVTVLKLHCKRKLPVGWNIQLSILINTAGLS